MGHRLTVMGWKSKDKYCFYASVVCPLQRDLLKALTIKATGGFVLPIYDF